VRLTEDVDVSVALAPDEAGAFLTYLPSVGFEILVDDPGTFLRETFVLPVLDTVSKIRIDLVFTSSEYERGAIARARKVIIDGETISYITPDDLVVVKIIAGRPRDIDDVRSVIDRQKLDLAHIRKWLKLFDDELGEDYEERLLSLLPKKSAGSL